MLSKEIVALLLGLVALKGLGKTLKQNQWEITVNGERFTQGQLNSREKRVVAVRVKNGVANVVIENGKIYIPRMAHHICPKGICTKMGSISQVGEQIVCMPNKIVVRIL